MAKRRSLSVTFLFATAGCFGAQPCNQYPLKPSMLPPCPSLLKQAWDAARDFKKAVAILNGQIGDARSHFWKVFPNGPGFEAAQTAFLGELVQKDLYYLMFSLQQGMTGDMAKMANATEVTADPLGLDPTTPRDLSKFPTNVDGGIRPFAFPLFVGWVNALPRSEGRDKDGPPRAVRRC